MEGPPLGPGGEDITWPNQVAPRGRKASSTRKIKPQTSNLFKTGVNRANTGDFLSFLIEAVILRGKGVGVIEPKSRHPPRLSQSGRPVRGRVSKS